MRILKFDPIAKRDVFNLAKNDRLHLSTRSCQNVRGHILCISQEGPKKVIRILQEEAFKSRVSGIFDRRSAAYDQGDVFHPPLAEHLLHVAQISSGEQVLDLATGTGLVAIPAAAAAHPGQVIGLDISAGMLEVVSINSQFLFISSFSRISCGILYHSLDEKIMLKLAYEF